MSERVIRWLFRRNFRGGGMCELTDEEYNRVDSLIRATTEWAELCRVESMQRAFEHSSTDEDELAANHHVGLVLAAEDSLGVAVREIISTVQLDRDTMTFDYVSIDATIATSHREQSLSYAESRTWRDALKKEKDAKQDAETG